MRLDTSELIAGVALLDVRRLLRGFNVEIGQLDVEHLLGLEDTAALALLVELTRLGLLKRRTTADGEYRWVPTIRGNALAGAKALAPMTQKTADALLQKVLDRAREVNQRSDFLYTIIRIDVFGSYLSDQPRINDLDLAIELRARLADEDEHFEACQRQSDEAYRAGRRFRTVADSLSWPEEKVRLFLRARSARVSLHPSDEPARLGAATRTVFSHDR